MSADTAMDAIDGLGYLKDKKQISKAVHDWSAANPNAAETVEAALNVAAAAKVAKLAGQSHPKTGVPFDNKGFPIFDKYSKFDTKINANQFRSTDSKGQMKMATQNLANQLKTGRSMRPASHLNR